MDDGAHTGGVQHHYMHGLCFDGMWDYHTRYERGVKVGLVWIWDLTLIRGLKKMTRKVQDGACVAAPLFWDSVLCR